MLGPMDRRQTRNTKSYQYDEISVLIPSGKRRRSPDRRERNSNANGGQGKDHGSGRKRDTEDPSLELSLPRLLRQRSKVNYNDNDDDYELDRVKRRRHLEDGRYEYQSFERREVPYSLRGAPLTYHEDVHVSSLDFEGDDERDDSAGDSGPKHDKPVATSRKRERATPPERKESSPKRSLRKHSASREIARKPSPEISDRPKRTSAKQKADIETDVEGRDSSDTNPGKQEVAESNSTDVDGEGDSDYEGSGDQRGDGGGPSSDSSETDSLIRAPTDSDATRLAVEDSPGEEGRRLRSTRMRNYNERNTFRAIYRGDLSNGTDRGVTSIVKRERRPNYGLRARRDPVDYSHDLQIKEALRIEQRAERQKNDLEPGRRHVGSSSYPMGRAFGGKGEHEEDSDSDADRERRRDRRGISSREVSDLLRTSSSIGSKLKPIAAETLGNENFDSVAGLENHISNLKEMIVLPLLYPELYYNFKVKPPRGVLFHGPPGTGKTMLARALANSCSTETQKVTFYARKGGDILSKWVGEGERQLGLLFDSAKNTQPAVIFFDEIDGLAPVRTTGKQEQSQSIVATLLGLMNGLDDRGQVVVIGATNRIDALDPALRRPGRFDREFYFPLPDQAARLKIVELASKDWNPPLADDIKEQLAEVTQGYAGADVKAIVTEAVLHAVRRVYPQIYKSSERLLVQPEKIKVEMVDFLGSLRTVVASTNRSSFSVARPLPKPLESLLTTSVQEIYAAIEVIFPIATKERRFEWLRQSSAFGSVSNPQIEFNVPFDGARTLLEESRYPFASYSYSASSLTFYQTFRPRILICGEAGLGQTNYVGPAILHMLESWKVFIQTFELGNLIRDAKDIESGLVSCFISLRRQQPACAYIPNVDTFWENLGATAQATFLHLLTGVLDPHEPVLLITTSERPLEQLIETMDVFMSHVFGLTGQVGKVSREKIIRRGVYELSSPTDAQRSQYFSRLYEEIKTPPPTPHVTIKSIDGTTLGILPQPKLNTALPELPKAPTPPTKPTESAEERRVKEKNAKLTLLSLRQTLREMTTKMLRRYNRFENNRARLINEDSIEYLRLRGILEKNERGAYMDVEEWLVDMDSFCKTESDRWKAVATNNPDFVNDELEAQRMIGDLHTEAHMFVEMQDIEFLDACRESAKLLRPEQEPGVNNDVSAQLEVEDGTPVPSDGDTGDKVDRNLHDVDGTDDFALEDAIRDSLESATRFTEFVVQKRSFEDLLNVSVVNTRGLNVMELEQLSMNLARIINARRGDQDRTCMIESLIDVLIDARKTHEAARMSE
ncbi:AAA-domain-containing protein [Gonapodya prolifera JEL478]|uniref:AAA-domain-containing protein n=1 Tax=Gonapodya prolifera (strain JEL478) TaxID=1344416 RepID=A0A139AUJ9_GONPJ|nr:AAA-domain-containing protein [Gonapodya prolifera JEL478]|eukprot:KXS20387.1 AAA-domain-containing protein [Gonapodya prolifera JEL478]